MGLKQMPKILRIGSPRRKEDADTSFRLPIDEMEGEIIVQEKLDGCNFRVSIHEPTDQLLFGSKKQVFIKDGVPLSPEELPGQYVKAAKVIRDEVGLEKVKEIEEWWVDGLEYGRNDIITQGMEEVDHGFLTLFLENMVLHSFDYDWESTPHVIGFDVYDSITEKFIHPRKAERMFDDLEIETAPTHRWIKEYEDFEPRELERMKIPESKYREGKKAEGVVIKNPRNQIYAKLHNEEFSELNEQVFGHTKKQAETDEERILARYCSNRRILKILQKEVVQKDKNLSMELLGEHKVHIKVYEDIFEEELHGIIHKRYEIDFYQLRTKVAERVRKVLKRRINIKERNQVSDQEALSMRWDK